MGVRAAFFDVGGTLVERWSPPEELTAVVRRHLVEAFGERDWYDALIAADIEPRDRPDRLRQETNRWYQAWFAGQGIACDSEIGSLVQGAEADRSARDECAVARGRRGLA